MIKIPEVETPLTIPTPKELAEMVGWAEPRGWTPPTMIDVEDGGTKVMDEWVSERAGSGARWPYPDMTEHHADTSAILARACEPYEAEATFVTKPGDLRALAPTPLLDMRADDTLPRVEYEDRKSVV